jgi:hypothetical protein
MATNKKDKTISALEAVHSALKGLNAQERQRVLASVGVLLEISPSAGPIHQKTDVVEEASSRPVPASDSQAGRPLAIRELIQDKKPRTHPQFITLFAYFREKHQNVPSFKRYDLKPYYAASRENPPKNFDRDFVETVRKGWIHEDGDDSYITSKGIEAVASGFAGGDEKQPLNLRRAQKRKKNKWKRKRAVAKKRT